MWYLFYELILDFSYNLCIIKVHGGNAMAVDVRPSSRFDDYFPDYQFGCGGAYSSMSILRKGGGVAPLFLLPAFIATVFWW